MASQSQIGVINTYNHDVFRLEPLVSRIAESPRSVLCPEIDVIDANSLQYSGVGGSSVGGFW